MLLQTVGPKNINILSLLVVNLSIITSLKSVVHFLGFTTVFYSSQLELINMCGIAGYRYLTGSPNFHAQDLLMALQRALRHRGPNGYGWWYSQDNTTGLAHCRLSVIDRSVYGAQPMVDSTHNFIITYNGELYNYQELRKELIAKGHKFSSTTDTEVILAAYAQWGIESLNYFDGIFAFALYDKRTDELYLVRDRIGVKPVYFTVQNGVFGFASEIQALWQIPGIKKEINLLGLYHYLTCLATPAPYTLYKQVYRLPPGFWIKVTANKQLQFYQWYTIKSNLLSSAAEDTVIQKASNLLLRAVEKQLVADVPIGILLSGGLDSSLLTAIVAKHNKSIKTFTIRFEESTGYDESMYARKVSQLCATEHHEYTLTEAQAFTIFQKIIDNSNEPFGDSLCIGLYAAAQLAREQNTPVVLFGEGADELFCGYDVYRDYLTVAPYYYRSQQLIPQWLRNKLYQVMCCISSQSRLRCLILKKWAAGQELFLGSSLGFDGFFKEKLWRSQEIPEQDAIVTALYAGMPQSFDSDALISYHRDLFRINNNSSDFLNEIMYLELKHRLSELLLPRFDRMTMLSGVEGRVPFLDHYLTEYMLSVPQELKYKNKTLKYILKQLAHKYLPTDIIYRQKKGFTIPLAHWLEKGCYFRPYFLDTLNSKEKAYSEILDLSYARKVLTTKATKNYAQEWWLLQSIISLEQT